MISVLPHHPQEVLTLCLLLYTITLGASSALTSSLRYVKLLTGYGGNSSNHTVFTICLLINFYLKCNI
jgi:hypothetical protein